MSRLFWKAAYLAVFFGVTWWVWKDEWNATSGIPHPSTASPGLVLGFLAALTLFLVMASISGVRWWLLERRERKRRARASTDVPLSGLRGLVKEGGDDARLVGGGPGSQKMLKERGGRRIGKDAR